MRIAFFIDDYLPSVHGVATSTATFRAALERILAACRRAGKPCLIFAGDGTAAAHRFSQGFDAVAMGQDATLLISGVRQQIAACRG